MNSAAELKRIEEQNALQKAKKKVIEALDKDPMGLSIAQLMTVCKLSIKTVKNILAVIDADQENGVFFLNNKPKADIDNKPQVAEAQLKPKTVKPVVDAGAVNVSEALLNLLNDFPEGLEKADIKAGLQITDKQFSNVIYKLTQSKKIKRSGKLGSYTYKLATDEVESPQPPAEQSETEIIEFHTPVPVQPTVVENPKIEPEPQTIMETTMSEQNTSVLHALRKLTETQIVQTQTLQLTQDQIGHALMEAFDFDRVNWTAEGGVILIKAHEMVA